MKIRYDLHIHSCLSPCADFDMTPATVAGMAKLQGLDIVALTDHNSTLNLPAFAAAAKYYKIAALYGMELSTSEDIHVLCLFDKLECAMFFGEWVDEKYPKIKNRPAVFGDQYVMDEDDNVKGNVEHLLIAASEIGFNELDCVVENFGGLAIPAHIDKEANSALAVLGSMPVETGYTVFELRDVENLKKIEASLSAESLFLTNSDAHRISDIGAAGGEIELDVFDENVAASFLNMCRKNKK